MPAVRSANVIAILCSDIHLSHTPPAARGGEADWYEAMRRPLQALRGLATKYKAPVICAGDIFHHWRSPPELINFALRELPDGMYAVPGQHDLPYHNYDDCHKSAYWTLVEAGKIIDIDIDSVHHLKQQSLYLYGHPWGHPQHYARPKAGYTDQLHIAVVHGYIWSSTNNRYHGAPDSGHVVSWHTQLDGMYDVAVFGDNHKHFVKAYKGTTYYNCGGFMRRASDERDRRPCVGLLHGDGTIATYELSIAGEIMDVTTTQGVDDASLHKLFAEHLEKLGGTGVDFWAALRQLLQRPDLTDATKAAIMETIETCRSA